MGDMIKINQNNCIKCGICEYECPKVFFVPEESEAVIVEEYRQNSEDIGEVSEEISCLKDAVEACPVNVIRVKE